jgi:purine catabolism regulator
MKSCSPILTVREALELPIFAHATVVAGHAGLDNRIRWVHIIDIPDADFEWGRRDVLLLTAGFGLQDNPESQATLVPILSEQGFAGVVLSIGPYFRHAPQVIRNTADELGFPLIEIPSDVLFVDITEAIFERIINRQYALLKQSNRIHARLTHLGFIKE